MFFVILGAAFAVPAALTFVNRVLEEHIIPRKMKTADNLHSRGFDVVLTELELTKLDATGAVDILKKGIHRHNLIAHKLDTCEHCKRLR